MVEKVNLIYYLLSYVYSIGWTRSPDVNTNSLYKYEQLQKTRKQTNCKNKRVNKKTNK